MLDDLKRILGVNNTEFDSIIQGLIKACKEDLKSVGIAASLVDSIDGDDPSELIKTAVVAYVRANFDDPTMQPAYDLMKDNLRKKQAYQEQEVI